uniref:Uncharacterized protein n=1 Tax=Tetranychus urticae TaxID=32264 RepID=T1L4J4_TETUR
MILKSKGDAASWALKRGVSTVICNGHEVMWAKKITIGTLDNYSPLKAEKLLK